VVIAATGPDCSHGSVVTGFLWWVSGFSLGFATTAFLSPLSIFFGGYLAGLLSAVVTPCIARSPSVGSAALFTSDILEVQLVDVSVAVADCSRLSGSVVIAATGPDCSHGSVLTGFLWWRLGFSLGSATTALLSPWPIFFGGYLAGPILPGCPIAASMFTWSPFLSRWRIAAGDPDWWPLQPWCLIAAMDR
jgi:hypothetical protein